MFTFFRLDDPLVYMHPEGLRMLLKYLSERCSIDMYVTIPEVNEIAAGVRDKLRMEFIREHVDEVLKGNHSSKIACTLYKRQSL